MRKFSSYGPINTALHYYVPRTALIEVACQQMLGDAFDDGGHYITVWAPRQRGKTWVMQQVLRALRADDRVDVVSLSLQQMQLFDDVDEVARRIAEEICYYLGMAASPVQSLRDFEKLFRNDRLSKPLILIFDEFDSLPPDAIIGLATILRNIYIQRQTEADLPASQKTYLLHGVALIGVRAVLGVENVSGSPFNVQRSIHIPNLTAAEVAYMFDWYQREAGQTIAQPVIDRLFYELQGQPGLTCWLGELLTETYNQTPEQPITMAQFEAVYRRALNLLPNNNIINIISKAKQEPYKTTVLNLFDTTDMQKFAYDDPHINFLYMNGVVEAAEVGERLYLKFPCPFVQKRLFNYFAREIFNTVGQLHDPFDDLSDTITDTRISIPHLLRRYERYLEKNRAWLLKQAPRRKEDLRIYEAVYHFNFYLFLAQFFQNDNVLVIPEFPTGNGKIDLLIDYAGQRYGLEVKSFANRRAYQSGLIQAAKYGHSLGLAEIWLVLFIEAVDETNRQTFEQPYTDMETGVLVHPQFVQLGVDEQALG